jgi:hypothetical protein
MNKDHCNLAVKLASAFLLTGVATAEQDQDSHSYYIDSSDSLSLSMRFGLNMSGKFLGGGGVTGSYDNGARTPNGDPYNFDNGYVLKDVSGNAGGQTVYYGFDKASQISGAPGVNQSLALNRTASAGENDSLYDPRIGAELTYNHLLGVNKDWHHLRYGVEMAANYTPLSFHDTVGGGITQYLYAFAPGVMAPAAPFQGNYYGAGPSGNPYAILNATPYAQSQVSSFIEQQDFKADLWGFRLGPYLEMPLTRKLSVHVSGGFAAALLDASASWSETSTPSGGGAPTTTSGGGQNVVPLYGEYARLSFSWQLDKNWDAEVGAQFQNLGVYSHDFGGRTVQLDLSQSIFVEAGITYRF